MSSESRDQSGPLSPSPSSEPKGKAQPKAESTWTRDFSASLVVFLVALPLCLGISIASGVPIATGLVTGIVAGIVVGYFAGCPLQVSGPAAGLTVVVYQAVQTHGLKSLGLIVLLAGIFQIIAAVLRFGQWFRAVSPAVVHGMLAGIGILIFASQFHVMLDDQPGSSGIKNLATIPSAIAKAAHPPQLPPNDLRTELQGILKSLGDLHRRQIGLNEEVTEQLPNHHVELDPDHKLDLSKFVERQQSILEETESLQAKGLNLLAHDDAKQQKVRDLGDRAIETLRVSLQALEQNQGDLIIPAQVKAGVSITSFQGAFKNHEFAAGLGVLTIVVLVLWKMLPIRSLKMVPAPLIGVLVATVIASFWHLPVLYVEVPTQIMEDLHFIKLASFQDVAWGGIITTAIVLAVIASAETLLCATAVDSLQSGPRTNYDKELFSQGIGNTICGCLGALPMTGVIVRSSANIQAGAKSRWSSVMHGVWLLIFVLFLASLLRMIPTACLAAILVYTGYKLVDLKAVRQLAKFGWSEVLIWSATVLVIVTEDLLMGVLTGLALAIGKLVLRFSRLRVTVENQHGGQSVVHFSGNASFLRLPKLARVMETVPEGSTVSFDLTSLAFLDQACLELLRQWGDQHTAKGGKVNVDWEALERFAREGHSRGKQTPDYSQVA